MHNWRFGLVPAESLANDQFPRIGRALTAHCNKADANADAVYIKASIDASTKEDNGTTKSPRCVKDRYFRTVAMTANHDFLLPDVSVPNSTFEV